MNNIIYFPHEDENTMINSKDIIKEVDIVFAEVSIASVGQGIELGWAEYLNKKIICIYKNGTKVSSSLKYITDTFIEYKNREEMIKKIEEEVYRE